jgi:hypothetical protein
MWYRIIFENDSHLYANGETRFKAKDGVMRRVVEFYAGDEINGLKIHSMDEFDEESDIQVVNMLMKENKEAHFYLRAMIIIIGVLTVGYIGLITYMGTRI